LPRHLEPDSFICAGYQRRFSISHGGSKPHTKVTKGHNGLEFVLRLREPL
jgi:hypothetical protein